MNQYYTYKDIEYYVQFEQPFHITIICKGYEVCSAPTVKAARDKFERMIDTGLVIKEPRVIGE